MGLEDRGAHAILAASSNDDRNTLRERFAARDGRMSVDLVRRTVVVRDERPHPAWTLAYLLIGITVIWVCLANTDTTDTANTYGGLAFGLLFAGLGAVWLMPGKVILQLDPAAQYVRAFSYGLLGPFVPRRIHSVAYAEIASIGTDTFKDPRNGAVWFVESVVRLKDGRRFAAGHRDQADKIGALSGLLVDHRIVWQEEPPPPSGE